MPWFLAFYEKRRDSILVAQIQLKLASNHPMDL